MKIFPFFADRGSLEASGVTRRADGVATGWPLLKVGDNYLNYQGAPANLRATQEDLQQIASYHESRKNKIPLDSRHVISNLAGKLGIDEAEVLKKLPRLSGTAGFADLKLEGDTLYLSGAEYNRIGEEAMKSGLWRYYSPTIRGLDGSTPLRITSVALDNEPLFQNLPSLAASEAAGEKEESRILSEEEIADALRQLKEEGEKKMTEDEKNVAAQASGESTTGAGAEEGTKKLDEIMSLLKEVLGEDVTPETLKAALAALKVKADTAPDLSARVAELEASEAARSRASVVERGKKEGKLTPQMLESGLFKKMTALELSDYLNVAPVVVAPGSLELSEFNKPPAAPKSLTPVQQAIASAPTRPVNN